MIGIAWPAIVFLLLHRVVSGSALRAKIVGRVGETAFRRTFAALSFACLIWLTAAYRFALLGPAGERLVEMPRSLSLLQWPLQFIALLFMIVGISTRNPATAGMQEAVREDVVSGYLRITRHPFLWGVAAMSAGHMLIMPDPASLFFFGTLLFLAATGTVSIDVKRRASLGADWQHFASSTSNLPFAAIIAGRQRLVLSEFGLARPVIAIALFAVVTALHRATHLVSAIRT